MQESSIVKHTKPMVDGLIQNGNTIVKQMH